MRRPSPIMNFHGDVVSFTCSPCSKTMETMKEGQGARERGGEKRLEGISRLGGWKHIGEITAGKAGQPNQGASAFRRAQGHRTSAVRAEVWGACFFCPCLAPTGKKKQNTCTAKGAKQPGKENRGCQLDSCVTSTSKVMKTYSPGCPGCLEHGSGGPTNFQLLSFNLPANLLASPLIFLSLSVFCHVR